jgi:ABC-type transport system involved in Fe-S cluster assembly fused permease/ATPase subunit
MHVGRASPLLVVFGQRSSSIESAQQKLLAIQHSLPLSMSTSQTSSRIDRKQWLWVSRRSTSNEVTLVAAPVAMDEVGWKFYLVLICTSVVYIVVYISCESSRTGWMVKTELLTIFVGSQNRRQVH